ncbi:anti-sigma-K factor RskA [Lentzea flaviverrucosa]|uniref:Regulator of SigK n=2 Tax=Lentzea flaviverrucosa TaxID=200379 RepID=A0A1H8ZTV0_9PSEU|nr:anti-sigma-K factor RskA [Lentzea flaviverrucosa]SEP67683.1 Anti-sigma-K factor RskA [Lentzea flaviverrucosa]
MTGQLRSSTVKPGMTRAINQHLLTGAHALGALPDAERAEFEAHLVRCWGCADEVAGLRETAARLGNAVDHVHPNFLRSQVLDAIRYVRQVPPASENVAVFSRRQGFRRAAALISAACVAAAAVAGLHGALTSSKITPVASSPRAHVGDLLAAPDLRLLSAGDQTGTAAMSRSRDEMLFLADDLRTLPRDRVYQLWLVDGQGPRSAGTTRPAGDVTSLLVSGIEGAGEVVLTVEPAGGSPGPTGAPVLTIALR